MKYCDVQVGQTVMVPGPDVLTTCGNPKALLKISGQYVTGVGAVCEPISDWSMLSSFSSRELQQLRDLAQSFDEGTLKCGALGFFPEYATLILFIAITIITSIYF